MNPPDGMNRQDALDHFKIIGLDRMFVESVRFDHQQCVVTSPNPVATQVKERQDQEPHG